MRDHEVINGQKQILYWTDISNTRLLNFSKDCPVLHSKYKTLLLFISLNQLGGITGNNILRF